MLTGILSLFGDVSLLGFCQLISRAPAFTEDRKMLRRRPAWSWEDKNRDKRESLKS